MTAIVEPYELGLDPPLRTGRETIETRCGLLFRAGSDPPGIGDSAPLQPFTESFAASRRALERAAEAFERDGWQGALSVVSAATDGRLQFPAARHAVSLAHLDREARKAGVPLYRFLGGEPVDSVPVNATVGDGSPEATATAAATAQANGFQTVKVKVGKKGVDRDLDRLRAVRDRVGDEIVLRADANGAWELAEARSFLVEAEPLELAYLEQPLASEEGTAHAELRTMGTPIGLDESLTDAGVTRLLEADAADVFVLKPMALGGVDVARVLVAQIHQASAEAVVTSIFESVVGRTGAIHLAASLPDLPPGGLATGDRFVTDLGPDPAPVRNGSIVPPAVPGLGVAEVIGDG